MGGGGGWLSREGRDALIRAHSSVVSIVGSFSGVSRLPAGIRSASNKINNPMVQIQQIQSTDNVLKPLDISPYITSMYSSMINPIFWFFVVAIVHVFTSIITGKGETTSSSYLVQPPLSQWISAPIKGQGRADHPSSSLDFPLLSNDQGLI
ncbi:hypothetical protein PAAG_06818 [Paracoccidioides lutzii Pb01]|uniref:Uncharacterized protein n=1 Tax=Paracoccidioides lutzii (strain ATCC MYA-826 / Pb01) TaxID=502779 RepID=C1H7S7_PARBA|nr:hypothetical protein PAAG_06818 [Paracoccidioides lutzii Pb01]EEH36400.2 hypothetical protein PAAG_06818 [Paracoccidioides lutzii Pb01]